MPNENRRQFIQKAMAAGLFFTLPIKSFADQTIQQPFENGLRNLVAFPQKRPLMVITQRPPHLETPFHIFNENIITPNDAFFVRYHLANIPLSIDLKNYRLKVTGKVTNPLELTLDEIKKVSDPIEIIAVNQCSGNGRGFSSPRVNGAQLGNGSMGNARWLGVPLKKVLERAGVQAGVVQATFRGLDEPVLPGTPRFIKALDIEHALDGEVMLAWSMNGENLPFLNGYPLRLVVPGYYSTYWVKQLSEINLIDHIYDGFFMSTAYRVPDTPEWSIPPGTTPQKTIPINHLKVRSFITSLKENDKIPAHRDTVIRGIAFDGGSGIKSVLFSQDGGQSWKEATLSQELGRYSFREWKIAFNPQQKGSYQLKTRAINRNNQIQPLENTWNPGGYARNVVEKINITAV